MKTMLVPLHDRDDAATTLEVAVLMAKRFGSYMEALMLSSAVNLFLAPDAIGATVVSDVDVAHDPERAVELRRYYDDFMRRHGVPEAPASGDGISYGWLEASVAGDGFVGSYGRVFDLTVVGQPVRSGHGPRLSTLEAALLESGRPILIAPPIVPRSIGDNVMIAWNGSTETARAIALAKPVLRSAGKVTVLTVEGSGVPGPSGEEVVRYLGRHGIAAEPATVKRSSQSVGETVLAQAGELGCDLIVKGAFTQSRLRQMIFGGTTQHLIARAGLPVFMSY